MCVSVNQECLGGFWGYSHAFCRPGKCVQRSQWHSHPTYAHRAAHARMSVSPTVWRQRTKRPTWCWIWPAIRRMCVCVICHVHDLLRQLCAFLIYIITGLSALTPPTTPFPVNSLHLLSISVACLPLVRSAISCAFCYCCAQRQCQNSKSSLYNVV